MRVKADAPAELVGAHIRFLRRTGTWEQLLLDLSQLLEVVDAERKLAVELLLEQLPDTQTPGGFCFSQLAR